MITYVSFDVETSSELDPKKVGFNTMAKNCELDALSWGVHPDVKTMPNEVKIWDCRAAEMPEELRLLLENPRVVWIGFNVGFDSQVVESTLGYDLTGRVLDSGVYNSVYGVSVSTLENTAKVLKCNHQKIELVPGLMKLFSSIPLYGKAKSFRGRKLYDKSGSIDLDYYNELRSVYMQYCIEDTYTSAELWVLAANKGDKYPYKNYCLDQKINKRGIGVDMNAVNRMVIISEGLKEYGKIELRKICNQDYEVASHPGFARYLKENVEGWKGGSTKDDVIELANSLDENDPLAIACNLKVAVCGTAGAKFSKVKAFTNPDTGRLYDQFRFRSSARTGRWSGSGVQMLNLPRPYKFKTYEEAAEAYNQNASWWVEKFGREAPIVAAKSVRAVFKPKKDHVYIDWDLNSIENVLATWFTQDPAALEIREKNLDPYVAFGSILFGLPYEEVMADHKAGGKMRQDSKPGVLGGTYALSGAGLVDYAKGMGIYFDLEFAKKTIKTWRDVHFGIVESWDFLDEAFKNMVYQDPGTTYALSEVMPMNPCVLERRKDAVVMRFPSGRGIWYQDPRVETVRIPLREPMRDRDSGLMRDYFDTQSFTYLNNKGSKVFRESTHGGKILGNTCQGIGLDIQSDWLMNVNKLGGDIVIHVHDQIVTEVHKEDVLRGNEIMEEAIPANFDPNHWSAGWGVGAEGEIIERFWK